MIVLLLVQSTGHAQTVTKGYITAVLRSECTSAPPPPPLGQTATGPDYVIMTVADGDPNDFVAAQQLVTDAMFESLMPSYCALPHNSGAGCVANRVQWQVVTYSPNGSPRISGCAASGCQFHYCGITNGYVTAAIVGASGALPTPPPLGGVATGNDSVMMTIADADPSNLGNAQQLATDAEFDSLMQKYCALPRGVGSGYASGSAQWKVVTFDPAGNLKESDCASSGCGFHSCVVSNGYVAAVLRSECTDAPPPPAPGQVTTGPDYVIMTVADANPNDFAAAQQLVSDSTFEILMPLYCALPRNTGVGCVTNRVQWQAITYDAGGNARISGCAASGCQFHYFAPEFSYISATPNVLWPPNGQMVPVTIHAGAGGGCGATRCKIVAVQSNESGKGHGNRIRDWQLTGDLTLNLRAERLGNGQGRIYTITVECTDENDNASTGTVTVSVPHDLAHAGKTPVRMSPVRD